MNWKIQISEYCVACQVAYCALREVRGAEARNGPYNPRCGAARTRDGKRIVWQYHGAGVRIRLTGGIHVDFDFTSTPEIAVTDVWKIAWTLRIPAPTPEEIASLVDAGVITDRKISFLLPL